MAQPPFDAIEACVFDAYGTLFDVHSAVAAHQRRLADLATPVSTVWRVKQLEYTWLRSLMGRYADFWQVTADALDYALDAHDVHDDALRDDLLQAYLSLRCYPEVPEVLARLRAAGLRTAILSNGSPRMLESAVQSAGIGELLDDVLSVHELGVFKPHPRVYQLAVDRLGVASEAIAFQSSNAWDAAGAAAFGFRVAWVNRFGQARERIPERPHQVLQTLHGLPDLVCRG